VLDISVSGMTGMTGTEAARRLSAAGSRARIVIFTMHDA
jgi:hypothetical protein